MLKKSIAVAVYDGLLGFEYGIVAELFGLVRPGLEESWYEYMPCRVERGELTTTHGLTLRPAFGLKQLASADTVVIPGWRRPGDGVLHHERPKPAFLDALQTAFNHGARIISVCSGAFVLGHAGLLDGRRVAAHWLHTDELQQTFPKAPRGKGQSLRS